MSKHDQLCNTLRPDSQGAGGCEDRLSPSLVSGPMLSEIADFDDPNLQFIDSYDCRSESAMPSRPVARTVANDGFGFNCFGIHPAVTILYLLQSDVADHSDIERFLLACLQALNLSC